VVRPALAVWVGKAAPDHRAALPATRGSTASPPGDRPFGTAEDCAAAWAWEMACAWADWVRATATAAAVISAMDCCTVAGVCDDVLAAEDAVDDKEELCVAAALENHAGLNTGGDAETSRVPHVRPSAATAAKPVTRPRRAEARNHGGGRRHFTLRDPADPPIWAA